MEVTQINSLVSAAMEVTSNKNQLACLGRDGSNTVDHEFTLLPPPGVVIIFHLVFGTWSLPSPLHRRKVVDALVVEKTPRANFQAPVENQSGTTAGSRHRECSCRMGWMCTLMCDSSSLEASIDGTRSFPTSSLLKTKSSSSEVKTESKSRAR